MKCQHLIGGQWCDGRGEKISVTSPWTGLEIASISRLAPEQLNESVQKSQKDFESWSRLTLEERLKKIENFGRYIDDAQLAKTIVQESGKLEVEALAEIGRGRDEIKSTLALMDTLTGGRKKVGARVLCEVHRKPLGVVAGITPFNFPAMVPLWMLPLSMGLGNAFIWKPSEKTPLSSLIIGEAALKAGLPLTILQGKKEEVEFLIDHDLVQSYGFVGNSSVAHTLYKRAAEKGKRILALGGARNHILVSPDANKEWAIKGVVESFTGCAGQRCMAGSVLVTLGEAKNWIADIVEEARSRVVCHKMGAIIDEASRDRLLTRIEECQKNGGTILLDGREFSLPKENEKGSWLAPTILTDIEKGSPLHLDELFGPVLVVFQAKNLDEALEIVGKSPYGNALSIFTSNGELAEKVCQNDYASMVGVNVGVPVPKGFPFGGVRYSKFGMGDMTGEGAWDLWSNRIKCTLRW